ncbi:MAG: hypothetical protein ACXWYB_08690, partial [Aeromicrobium sp.]
MTGGTLTRSVGGINADLTITGLFKASGGSILPSAIPGSLITTGATIVDGPVTSFRDWNNSGTMSVTGQLTM